MIEDQLRILQEMSGVAGIVSPRGIGRRESCPEETAAVKDAEICTNCGMIKCDCDHSKDKEECDYKDMKESGGRSTTWHVHVDAAAVKYNHSFRDKGKDSAYDRVSAHLHSSGLGAHAKHIDSVGYHDVTVGNLSRDNAHKVMHSLHKKWPKPTKEYADEYGLKHAVDAQQHNIHIDTFKAKGRKPATQHLDTTSDPTGVSMNPTSHPMKKTFFDKYDAEHSATIDRMVGIKKESEFNENIPLTWVPATQKSKDSMYHHQTNLSGQDLQGIHKGLEKRGFKKSTDRGEPFYGHSDGSRVYTVDSGSKMAASSTIKVHTAQARSHVDSIHTGTEHRPIQQPPIDGGGSSHAGYITTKKKSDLSSMKEFTPYDHGTHLAESVSARFDDNRHGG